MLDGKRLGSVVRELENRGWPVLLTAAPGEGEQRIVNAILASTGGAGISLAGALSLKEMAALSARAKLFIGVDSAPIHIAAAMETPVVALFGPSGERHWGHGPMDCRPKRRTGSSPASGTPVALRHRRLRRRQGGVALCSCRQRAVLEAALAVLAR